MIKPLPPFGKRLKELLASGQKPLNNVFIFVGTAAWQKAKAFEKNQYVLALPYGADPSEYEWPVKGCHPLVFDTGGTYLEADTIRKLAYILLASGAIKVHIALFKGPLVIYQKEATL